jgi:hypothetical protein
MDGEGEIYPPGDKLTDRRADEACQFDRAGRTRWLVWVGPICMM